MAYRFKLKETLRDGVRRIASEQLEKTLSAPPIEAERPVWVHETRKTLKRTRSLLRCVRSGLDADTWERENGALRTIGRQLSGMRDRDVLRQTVGKLATSPSKTMVAAMAWLEAEVIDGTPAVPAAASANPDAVSDPASVIEDALRALAEARDRLERIAVEGDIADVLSAGLAKAQRVGREAGAKLEAEPTDEHLHDLRKAVQIYQRQSSLARASWPEMQAARVVAARELATLLGDAQDLAVLIAAVNASVEGSGFDRAHAKRILKACEARQVTLRSQARPLTERLFALPPKAVATEIARGWRAAIDMVSDKPKRSSRGSVRQSRRTSA